MSDKPFDIGPVTLSFPAIDPHTAELCPFVFKGPQCGYTGAANDCKKTALACRLHANFAHFGGRLKDGFE